MHLHPPNPLRQFRFVTASPLDVDSYQVEHLDPGRLGVAINDCSTATSAIASISGLLSRTDAQRVDSANTITGDREQFDSVGPASG